MATGTKVTGNATEQVHTWYNGSLAKTLNEQSPAVARLQETGNVENRVVQRISWPAVSDPHGDANTIADGGVLPTASREEITKAVLDYMIYIHTIRVGRKLNMGGKSPGEFFATAEGVDILTSELNRAIPQVARTIHKHIVAATTAGANDLVGLGDAVGKNNNTYAGIARAANAYWQPYVNDNGGVDRSVTRAMLEDMVSNLVETRGASVSEVWCGFTAWNAIRNLINTISASRNQDPDNLRAGAQAIYWEGIPFVRMPQMDANASYWLDLGTDGGVKLLFQHPDGQDFLFKEEDTDSYDYRWSLAAHVCLQVHNPFKQGALLDIQ